MIEKRNFSWYWNLIHYNLYKWEKLAQKFFNAPFVFFLNSKSVRNAYKKRGVDNPIQEIQRALDDKEHGTNSILAGIHMGGLLVILEYSIFNFVQFFFNNSLIKDVWINPLFLALFILFLLIPSFLINYEILFKENRYLRYFEIFDSYEKGESLKLSVLSFFIIIVIWAILIVSYYFTIPH